MFLQCINAQALRDCRVVNVPRQYWTGKFVLSFPGNICLFFASSCVRALSMAFSNLITWHRCFQEPTGHLGGTHGIRDVPCKIWPLCASSVRVVQHKAKKSRSMPEIQDMHARKVTKSDVTLSFKIFIQGEITF